MKKYILMLVILAFATNIFGQTAPGTPDLQDQAAAWTKKSRACRTAAISMVSVGTFMIIGGIYSGLNSGTDGTGAGIVALTGIALNLGSIPFTVMANVNRKKAKQASLSFSATPAPSIQTAGHLRQKIQSGFTIGFPIGK